MKKGIYAEYGVTLSKSVLRAGDELELIYNGLLKNCGAGDVRAHIGYNETWEDAVTLDMAPINDAFVVRLTLKKAGTINCAFVDPLGNWDNNSGSNYSFTVSEPRSTSRGKKTAEKAAKASETNKVEKPKKETQAKKSSKKSRDN